MVEKERSQFISSIYCPNIARRTISGRLEPGNCTLANKSLAVSRTTVTQSSEQVQSEGSLETP